MSEKSSSYLSLENIARHPPLPMYQPESSPNPSSVRSTWRPVLLINFMRRAPSSIACKKENTTSSTTSGMMEPRLDGATSVPRHLRATGEFAWGCKRAPQFRIAASRTFSTRSFANSSISDVGILSWPPWNTSRTGHAGLCLLKTPSTAQSLTFPRSGSSSPTPMLPLLYAICATARSSLRPRRELALQNLARRRRVGVAKAVTKKPRASPRGGIESDVTSFWETSAPPVLRQGRGGKRGPGSFSVRGRVCADRFWKRPTGTSGLLALRQHLT